VTGSAPRRGFLDLAFGELHYRTATAAPGAPLLLILHQSPLSSRRYESVLPLLAARVRPVAIDTPGFGCSDHLPQHWTVGQYAKLVWEVADALGHRTAILFGRATGSVFALEAAAREPERSLGLVLHGFPLYTRQERQDRLASFADPFRIDRTGTHLHWLWRRIYDQYPDLDPSLATSFVEDYLAAGQDYASAYRAIWRYDPTPAIAALRLPTLLLGGTADRVYPLHRRLVAALGGATSVTIEGATDFVAEEQPARFAETVLDARSALGVLPDSG
jgi:pimeloyl-ACP methyl ester carboxylesterase